MIYYILGFLSWPISGYFYISIYNTIWYLKKKHPMGFHMWYEGCLGPLVIVFSVIQYFHRVKMDTTPGKSNTF